MQFHKIVNEKTPSYKRDKLLPIRRTLIDLPNVFQSIRSCTNRHSRSFFPDSTSIWNNVISNFEIMPSYDVLKSHLNSLVRPKMKSTFNIHYPSHLRFVFQLRLHLSQLRQHKKNYSFAVTPSIICSCRNGIEDTPHFLSFILLSINQPKNNFDHLDRRDSW